MGLRQSLRFVRWRAVAAAIDQNNIERTLCHQAVKALRVGHFESQQTRMQTHRQGDGSLHGRELHGHKNHGVWLETASPVAGASLAVSSMSNAMAIGPTAVSSSVLSSVGGDAVSNKQTNVALTSSAMVST